MEMKERLAVDGGTPVRASLLPYGRQCIEDDDIAAVVEVLRSDWLTTGPAVGEFEEAFAAEVGAKHAVAIANGTAALHAAAYAAGITCGDEVIVTPMTFAATANCVRYMGGKVVFADVLPGSLNLDPAKVESLITPLTRAIITVDYTGLPSELDEFNSLARRHGVRIIQDASHSLGATYRGRKVGTLCDLTTFSMHPVKQITTGEGGVITTDNRELAARLRLLRNHGISSDHRQRQATGSWFYEMLDLGYNYRLTDFQCALGRSQLRKLGRWVARRREIAARYTRAFSALPEIETPVVDADRESAWHLYVIRLNLGSLQGNRDLFFKALRGENIAVNVHYIPVPWHPYYQRLGYRKGCWPVAEAAYERMISLPIFPAMSDGDVDDVIIAVEKVLRHFRV
jgi:perosamine synthetase